MNADDAGQLDAPLPTLSPLIRGAAWFYFQFYVLVLRWLGRMSLPAAIRWSERINAPFMLPMRRMRKRNFALLFPGALAAEQLRFEQAYAKHMARTRASFGWMAFNAGRDELLDTATVHGREHLDRALARGQGVLLLEAHLGNWTFTPAVLAGLGYPISIVSNARAIGTINLRPLHERLCRKFGVQLGHVGHGAYETARQAFRQKGIFYSNLDIAISTSRLEWMPLGPAALPVDTGPAILARRHQVSVLFAKNIQTSTGISITLIPLPPADDAGAAGSKKLPEAWAETMRQIIFENFNQWWALQYVHLRRLPPGKNSPSTP